MAKRTTRSRTSTAATTNSRSGGGGRRRPAPKPFTVDHFRRYARNLVLDNGDYWEPENFQLLVVESLFQGVTEVWMVVPEENAKTTLMGGVSLYHADYTETASVVMGASSRDQCGWLFGAAAGFVHRTPPMRQRFRVFEGYRKIRALRSGGEIQVYAADDRTGDGVIPTLALLDELHRHRDLRLYRTWRGKLGKRGGQIGAISTAGEPDSEFEITRARIRSNAQIVRRERAYLRAESPGIVMHEWAVPSDGSVEDMRQVKAANPLKAITVKSLRDKRKSSTMTLQHWQRFCCNQAVRLSESAVEPSEWDGAGTDEEIPRGASVALGVDLGWKHDTSALVPLWVPEPTKRLLGVPEILTPPRDGTSLHPSEVEAAFLRIHRRNPVELVVLDPSAGGEQLAAWLTDEYGIEVIAHGQGNAPMATAYERFMAALRSGWLKHPRDPELTRHVLNAVARMLPDGRVRFDRPSSSRAAAMQDRRVIDALVAASFVNSLGVDDPTAQSVYQTRDLMVLS